jgi:hypothetical protein
MLAELELVAGIQRFNGGGSITFNSDADIMFSLKHDFIKRWNGVAHKHSAK